LEANIIEIEVSTSYGFCHFEIVGLPDKAINESKERVGAAIESWNHGQCPNNFLKFELEVKV
jgi:predicted ATPase with chaperone activity